MFMPDVVCACVCSMFDEYGCVHAICVCYMLDMYVYVACSMLGVLCLCLYLCYMLMYLLCVFVCVYVLCLCACYRCV